MNARTLFKTFAAGLLGIACLSVAPGASAAPPDKAPDKSPAKTAPAAAAPAATSAAIDLKAKQAQLEKKFDELEKAINRLAEVVAVTEPKQAAILRQAFAECRQRGIGDKFKQLVDELQKDQLFTAAKGQADVEKDLTRILEILQSGDPQRRGETEREMVRKILAGLNKLIPKVEGDYNLNLDGDGDPRDIAGRVKNEAEDAHKLVDAVKQIEPKDNSSNPAGDKNQDGKNQNGGKGQGGDKGQPGDKGQGGDGQKGQNGEKGQNGGKGNDGNKSPGDNKNQQGQEGKNKGQPGQNGQGKNGQGQPGQGQPGQGQPGQGQPGKGLPGEGQKGQPGKGDQGKGQPGKGDQGKNQPGKGEPSKGEPGKGQPGQGQPGQGGEGQGKGGQGQGKGGQGKRGQGQGGEGEGGQSPPSGEQSDNESPARKRIQAAEDRLRSAQKRLEQAKRGDAAKEQEEALKELKIAKEELEKILRQLREEEIERVLAQLEGRFRKMLGMQIEVWEGTVRLDKVPQAERGHDDEIESARLSRNESLIVVEADRALNIMHEEGSSIALPEATEQMREDMQQIVDRLSRTKTDGLTQGHEQDVIKALEEIIAVLQKLQREHKARQKPRPGQGQEGEESLVDKITELKMIRALQMRVNITTNRYHELLDKGAEKADQPELIQALQKLGEREVRVRQVTHDIAVGKNR